MSIAPDRNTVAGGAPARADAVESSPAETSVYATLGLTAREAEVLHWVVEGKRDREIASIMGVSARTAQHHVSHILHKLCVETRTATARVALERTARLLAFARARLHRRPAGIVSHSRRASEWHLARDAFDCSKLPRYRRLCSAPPPLRPSNR